MQFKELIWFYQFVVNAKLMMLNGLEAPKSERKRSRVWAEQEKDTVMRFLMTGVKHF